MHPAGPLALCCLVIGLATPARADIDPVGPFLGDGWESFEFVGNPGSYTSVPILDGGANVSNPFAPVVIVAISLYNFPNDIEVTAYNGNYFLGTPVGQMEIDFSTPIHAVGGYLTNAGPGFETTDTSMFGTAEFLDAGGVSLGQAEPIELVFGEWMWHGWTSDQPFSTVRFTAGTYPPGEIVLIDDLVYSLTPIPEPTIAALAGLAGALLLRRRPRAA